jgi:hypothetical protein
VTPKDILEGRRALIHAERDRKLEKARQQREAATRTKADSAIKQRVA